QAGCDAIFVVGCAATPYETVLADGPEWIDRPLFALHADGIGVPHHNDWLLAPIAFQTCDQVCTIRLRRKDLVRDSFAIQDALEIVDYRGLVTGRVAGVDPDNRFEMLECFRPYLLPIYDRFGSQSLKGSDQKQWEQRPSAHGKHALHVSSSRCGS